MHHLEEIRRKKTIIIWLFLIILFLITLYLKVYPKTLDDTIVIERATREIANELFTALLTLITFGLIYQVYTENENRQLAKKDLIEALQADQSTMELFSTEARMGFIKKTISSIIGDRYGALLYKNMIEKYLEGNLAYRENFRYDVELNEAQKDFTFKGETVLSKEKYYALEQNLVYSKHFNKKHNDLEFKIVFAFNDKSLDYWMNDENVFFREILKIGDWENDISKYSTEDFRKFVQDCLSLKFRFLDNNDVELAAGLSYNINYVNNEDTRGIEITVTDKKILRSITMTDAYSSYYRCELSFNMPYQKTTTRFHFSLPEPTLNPVFTIRFDKSFKNIDYFTHFSNISKKDKVKVDHNKQKYSISAFEIIYPRSGIVFFWDA